MNIDLETGRKIRRQRESLPKPDEVRKPQLLSNGITLAEAVEKFKKSQLEASEQNDNRVIVF